MNNTFKAIAFSMLAATIGASGAANASTGSADATATILTPIVVTKTDNLEFGKIVAGSSPSTVEVGASSFTCGAVTCTGSHKAAGFGLTGTDGESVSVASDASVTLTSGSDTMTATLTPSDTSLTLASGAASFTVGGTLSVGANQASGAYTGSFNVTVDYQ
jgi:Mat/Ecp fimbriae major subunit